MRQTQWRLIGLVTLWQVTASLIYYAIFAATPFFRNEFGLSRFLVGLIITFLSLGYAVSLLPIGAATDRFGERRILTIGLFGLAAGATGVAVSWSYLSVLGTVFVVGVLYGTAMPGTNKAIFDRIAEARRNLALGIKQVGVTAGSGLSALLVTGVAGVAFWQASFYIGAGVAAAFAAAFWVLYPAASGTNTSTLPSFRSLSRNTPYVLLVVAGFFIGAAIFTTTAYTVLYVNESISGASVAVGGIVLALLQVTASIGRIGFGWLCDRLPGIQRRRTAAVLLGQLLVGTVLFWAVIGANSVLGAVIAFGGLGIFALGNTGVYYACLGALVPADEIGAATAGGQVALTTGGLVMPPLFGLAVDMIGYWAGWTVLAAAGLAAAMLVWIVYRTPAPIEQSQKITSEASKPLD